MSNNKQPQQQPFHPLLHTEEFLEKVEHELHYHHPELVERQHAIQRKIKLPFCLRRVEESANMNGQTFVIGSVGDGSDEAVEG